MVNGRSKEGTCRVISSTEFDLKKDTVIIVWLSFVKRIRNEEKHLVAAMNDFSFQPIKFLAFDTNNLFSVSCKKRKFTFGHFLYISGA